MADHEFTPNETMRIKLGRSRNGREVVGTGSGLGSAAVVLWIAGLLGLEIDPVAAGVIGSFITSTVSAVIRRRMSNISALYEAH